jgi:hypothetical protein
VWGGGGEEEGEKRVRDERVKVEELRMNGWMDEKGKEREETKKEDRQTM